MDCVDFSDFGTSELRDASSFFLDNGIIVV